MRIPSVIKDPMVIYHCMRTCLMTAMESGIDSIVIPAFGGGCGFGSMLAGGDQKNRGDI